MAFIDVVHHAVMKRTCSMRVQSLIFYQDGSGGVLKTPHPCIWKCQTINFVYTRKKTLFACVQVDGVLVPYNVM